MLKVLIFMLGFLPLWSFGQTSDYIDACGKFITPAEISYSNDEASQLAILTLMTSSASTDQELKSKFSALLPIGLLDGSLKAAQQRKEDLEKRLQINMSRRQSQGYLAKYLTPDGANAFSSCVRSVFEKPGLHVMVTNADSVAITVVAKYVAQAGETRNLAFAVNTDGITQWRQRLTLAPSGGERRFLIGRANPSKDTHTNIDILSGETIIHSGDAFAPPYQNWKKQRENGDPAVSPISVATCGGNRDDKTKYGNIVDVVAPPGFMLDTERIERHNTEIGTGRGIQPGAGTDLEFLAVGPTKVSARAVCVPGNNTDHSYFYKSAFRVAVYNEQIIAEVPASNGIKPVMQQIKGCRFIDSWLGDC